MRKIAANAITAYRFVDVAIVCLVFFVFILLIPFLVILEQNKTKKAAFHAARAKDRNPLT